jgi:c-di-GMP-binding flagellar brake protein YcgR
MLHDIAPAEILQTVLEKNTPLFLSYFAGRRWHVVRVLMNQIHRDNFEVRVSPKKKDRSVSINVDQHVGVSFRYEYAQDNFVFDSSVLALKSGEDDSHDQTITLAMPEQVELVKKRNYVRVCVPPSVSVDVQLRRYSISSGPGPTADIYHSWHAKLVDISAGGLQLAIDASQAPDLQEEEFVIVKFVPSPHESPLTFNAYVRNIVPASSNGMFCAGLEIVGLEASPEGRMILQRICCIVEQYNIMNKMPC